jgi:hypothetical protein
MHLKIIFILLTFCPCFVSAGSPADSIVKAIGKSQKHNLLRTDVKKIHPTEDSLYHTKSWITYLFKASKPLKTEGPEKYFLKYSASVLTFEDSTQAAKRLDSVTAYYLKEDEYIKKMQFGLQIGNQVIFLTTNPVIFMEPLNDLFKTYRKKIPTAKVAASQAE